MDVASLQGLWRRSLIVRGGGERDTTTQVYWLQGSRASIDLRRPTGAPDFSHARSLHELSLADCARLARQEGFAGYLRRDGRWFEWVREIDFQPPGAQADAGALEWSGDVLIETGRDADYVEHWRRDPSRPVQPTSLAILSPGVSTPKAVLLRVGLDFMYARDRAIKLDAGYRTLCEYVARAPDLAGAQRLVDCEISFGTLESAGLRIRASTLPYRVGALLEEQ
jgi:hypothetical protein